MAPRPRWWHQLQDSKNEVLLAVDLYNRSGMERQLEALIVHMSIGWLKLLQARYERDGLDLYIRNSRGQRQRTRDGDWVTKPLHQMSSEEFDERDPRRVNLEFFIGLRNKIEHRHERDVATLIAGKTQALLLNYERTLIENFGAGESLADCLRFPLFVSTITDDAVSAIKEVRKRVPRTVLDYVQDFDASVEFDISSDQSYDFRIYLVPKTGSKTEADVAMSFVRLEDLDKDQLGLMEKMQTVIREKQVPIEDLGSLLPKQVVAKIQNGLGWKFTVNDHARAWKHFDVRPPEGSEYPEQTKQQFCRYNILFGRHVYTEAWVKYLIRKLGDPEEFEKIVGHSPRPLDPA
ncbi:DUF3644 domain-containing protein [Spirillospora sp. NPDC049024]